MTGILVNQFPQHTDVGLWTLCRLCVRSHHPIPELWHQGQAAFFYQSGHLDQQQAVLQRGNWHVYFSVACQYRYGSCHVHVSFQLKIFTRLQTGDMFL